MFKKLRAMIDHPYAAPLVQAVKGVGAIAVAPVGDFFENIKNAFEDDYYYDEEEKARPKLLRMYGEMVRDDGFSGFISVAGMVITAIGGAIGAGIMAAGAGAGALGIVGACAAAVGVGVAAGPFIAAGVVMALAATVGSVIGGVPGFIKGCGMAIDHVKQGKAQGQVAAALPPAQAQDEELTKNLARALAAFKDLPKEQRSTYVKMMNEEHMQEHWDMTGKLLQAFDSMNDRDRKALVTGLRTRLKDEFTDLAKAEANDSTVLQKEITVDGPLKLKRPQASA